MGDLQEEILSVIKNLKEKENFLSTQTGEDEVTNSTSWDITYKQDLKSLYKDIDNVVKRLEKLNREKQSPKSEELMHFAKTLRNKFARLLKNYTTLKEQSSGGTGGASFTPGEGMNYSTPKSFKKNSKTKPTSGYLNVPKKIKGSSLEVKKLYEAEFNDFQKERINIFDKIETELNDMSSLISNAKNTTIEYYSSNPGSYDVINSTDLILDYIKDIKTLLKGE